MKKDTIENEGDGGGGEVEGASGADGVGEDSAGFEPLDELDKYNTANIRASAMTPNSKRLPFALKKALALPRQLS